MVCYIVFMFSILQLITSSGEYIPLIVDNGVSISSQEQFQSTVSNILRSVSLGWQETTAYPKLVQSFFVSSVTLPSSTSFEKFIGSDIDYDPANIIKFTEWVPRVPNDQRESFENKTLEYFPDFQIYLFDSQGERVVEKRNSALEYHPITYCSPRYDSLVGFDLFNDKIEGSFLRLARDTGEPSSSPPFLLRGLVDTFKMGMTLYLPLYAVNSTQIDLTQPNIYLSKQKSPQYWGCIVVVIHFQSLLNSILEGLGLQNIDVFLFHQADTTYVAHFEFGPPQTRPYYSPDNVSKIRPADITGDLVTAYTPHYDIRIAGRAFRLLVRSRAGSNPRDVRIVSRQSDGRVLVCTKMNKCVMAEQRAMMVVTVEDALAREITYQTIGGVGRGVCAPTNSSVCNISLTEGREGIYILELFVNGEQGVFKLTSLDMQIPSSPILYTVTTRSCGEGNMVASADGLCVCPNSASLIFFGRCVSTLMLLPIIMPMVFLLIAAGVLVRAARKDREREQILDEVARLRGLLQLRWVDGFVLSSEWRPAWLTTGFLRQRQRQVTIPSKHLEAAARLSLLRDDFEPSGLDLLCLGLQDSPAQRERLRGWLLSVCSMLIDPDAENGPNLRFNRRRSFEVSSLFAMRVVPGDCQCTVWSQNRRYDYFRSKVCRLLLWREEGQALLEELRLVAQHLMDNMADRYEDRYSKLCSGNRGMELRGIELCLTPVSVATGRIIARQDDEQVKAIRVDEESALEARAQSMLAENLLLKTPLDEEPFVAQLCLRSKLLNDPFRRRIVEIVGEHAVESSRLLTQRAISRKSSLRSMHESHARDAGLPPAVIIECMFEEGPGTVEVHAAPIKTVARMREKLLEYENSEFRGVWPYAANILDPIRVSVVCEGASQILQVLGWFTSTESMPVCRIKNKFAQDEISTSTEWSRGYRDLKVFVLMEGFSSLRIIGEIQIHDRVFFDLKHKTHQLYKIVRAQGIDAL